MKTVLFITYYSYPPGLPSVQRILQFASHLKNYNYKSIVLTAEPNKEQVYTASGLKNLSLNSEISSWVKVITIPTYENSFLFKLVKNIKCMRGLLSFFLLPDEGIFWVGSAIKAGLEIIKREKVDLIYASSPPYSMQFAGLFLSRLTQLPWLAEFRDPWTSTFIKYWPSKFHYCIDRKMEKIIYKKARKIIVVTPMCKDDVLKKDKHIEPSKIHLIPNGYNEEDFSLTKKLRRSKKFTLTYSGRFHREYIREFDEGVKLKALLAGKSFQYIKYKIKYKVSPIDYNSTSPYYFLKAINRLLNIHPEIRDKIKVRFIGFLGGKNNRALVKQFALDDIVEVTGYLEHTKCIDIIRQSNVLVYILGYSEKPLYTVAGKLYEYMASKIPILALIPEGDSKEFLKKSGLAFFAHPKNIEDIADKIYELYKKWESGSIAVHPNYEFISQFERKKLTWKLADVFDEVLR